MFECLLRNGCLLVLAILCAFTTLGERLQLSESAASASLSTRLLIFGHVYSQDRNWPSRDCNLKISVEIGDQVWRQELNTSSYAFEVPVNTFVGLIGIMCIHIPGDEKCVNSLWRHFFVVKDVGVQQLDATLVGGCKEDVFGGGGDEGDMSWTSSPSHVSSLNERKAISQLALRIPSSSALATVDSPGTCPSHASYDERTCVIVGALELFSKAHYECRRSFSTGIFGIYVRTVLDELGDGSRWHRVFGVLCLQTWHLQCVVLFFLISELIIRLLTSFETLAGELLSEKCITTVNALSHDVLNWELRTSCPSSGSSLWCQAVRPKRSNNLIRSGKSAYPDAWSSAEHHLSDLLGGPAEGLCFYYNCTSQYRSLCELLVPAGRWSRDSNGRLTRQ